MRRVIPLFFLVIVPFAAAVDVSPQRALVNQYCLGCHNNKVKTAGIAFDSLDFDNIGAGAAAWEKVLRKLRAGEMPPPRLPRPQAPAATEFTSWLEHVLDAAATASPNPGGRPSIGSTVPNTAM